jgi:guanylate kinase
LALTSFTAPLPDRRPIVISGPSGVGKGTLRQKLFDAYPDTFALTVSHTTRKPRPGEVDGVDYFFTTPSTFTSLISQDSFVEHARFGDNYYGTSKQTIADQTAKGRVVVLEVEMEGVKQMRASSSIDARYVFIKPPALETLEARLKGRSTENAGDIQKRLAQAKVELEFADTPGVHDKIIVNDDLDKAFEELHKFVYPSAS